MLIFLAVLLLVPQTRADEAAAWKALAAGGHVALVRHANAPGNFEGSAKTVVLKPDRKSARGARVIGRIAAPPL